jgi:DNA-directed RNA polymerase subunit B
MCRLKNLTYAAPLYFSLRVETQEPSETGVVYKGSSASRVYVGTVPVMVGSSLCHTREEKGAEIDEGAYFIVKGNEKVIPWFRTTDKHSIVCYKGPEGETYATIRNGTHRGKICSTRMKKSVDGAATLKFQGSFRVGGSVTPGEALAALGVRDPLSSVYREMLYEDAAFYGESSFALDDADVANVADVSGMFPGTEPRLKSRALVSMMRMARYMRETEFLTERDSLQSQQLEGVREILTEVFMKSMRATAKTLKQRFETRLRKLHVQRHDNKNHRGSTLQMPNATWVAEQLTRFNSISAGLHYFCATGNLQGGGRGGRSGCCQILERTSELQMQSCMNKVVTPLDAQAAPTCARQLRPDMLGYLCPAATPEGKRTGLINQRAVGASVSRQRFDAVPTLLDIMGGVLVSEVSACGAKLGGVWISGRFVGNTMSCASVAQVIRTARRMGQIPRDIGVSVYANVAVEIRVHSGRMLKPLIPVVADAEPFPTNTTWPNLIHGGYVETLDGREEGGMYVCACDKPANPRHTHRELFPTASLGCVAATTPFADHMPSPRVSYYTSQAQQAMGFDFRNFARNRMDTKSFGLWYPQRSLVNTSYQRSSKDEERAPAGVNVVVAIMALPGAQEDAIIVNKSAVQRGLFRGTQWDTKTVTTAARAEMCFASPAEATTSVFDDPVGTKLHLGTGLLPPGSTVKSGEPLAGLGSARGVSTVKHASNALPGTVQRVVVYDNAQGCREAKIKVRTDRPLAIGDKLSSRSAQKGVVSELRSEHDMPWLEDGGRIDMIVHPCFLPSRMTCSQIMEHVAGFAACQLGLPYVDATAFAHSMTSLVHSLRSKGFKSSARWVRDPVTGERYPQKVEIGVTKYNRLNKYASDKTRLRTWGKRDLVTGQPVAGRGAGEKALRLGVMETTALQAHGGAQTLNDASRDRSDGMTCNVCGKCGNVHLKEKHAPCPVCGGALVSVQTTMATLRMLQVCDAMGVGTHVDTKADTI